MTVTDNRNLTQNLNLFSLGEEYLQDLFIFYHIECWRRVCEDGKAPFDSFVLASTAVLWPPVHDRNLD